MHWATKSQIEKKKGKLESTGKKSERDCTRLTHVSKNGAACLIVRSPNDNVEKNQPTCDKAVIISGSVQSDSRRATEKIAIRYSENRTLRWRNKQVMNKVNQSHLCLSLTDCHVKLLEFPRSGSFTCKKATREVYEKLKRTLIYHFN